MCSSAPASPEQVREEFVYTEEPGRIEQGPFFKAGYDRALREVEEALRERRTAAVVGSGYRFGINDAIDICDRLRAGGERP